MLLHNSAYFLMSGYSFCPNAREKYLNLIYIERESNHIYISSLIYITTIILRTFCIMILQ